jgi:hypothetical protein
MNTQYSLIAVFFSSAHKIQHCPTQTGHAQKGVPRLGGGYC